MSKMIKTEDTIMKETLIAMRKLGGSVTRKEIKREIRENSDVISEEMVDEIRVSKKSKQPYHPFDYRFNFAVKHLISAQFITKDSNNHYLTLSSKGLSCNLDEFDAEKDVRRVKKSEPNTKIADEVSTDNDTTESVEDEWKSELLDALAKMSPQKFEVFCRGLMKKMGIEVDDSLGVQYIADGGIDGFGYVTSDDFRMSKVALQAKRWQGKVSSPEIDKFRGAMDKFNAEFGIFITNSDFTRSAIKAARQGTRMITLINGDEICNLVAKYQYFVKPVTTYQLESFYTEE